MTNYQITQSTAGAVVARDLSTLTASWLEYNADKSPCTIRAYAQAIRNFLEWLKSNGYKNPDRKIVINYRNKLCSDKSVATARLYLAAVKTFSKWLVSNGLYPVDFAANVKLPSLDEEGEVHKRDSLTLPEVKSVLGAMTGASEKSIRDRLVMQIMAHCGLRTCEICRLDVRDIEQRHGKTFLLVTGKGRHSKARVELPKKLYQELRNYLTQRGAKKGEPMFRSVANRNFGARLQTQTLSRLAKSTLRTVGIDSPRVSAHSLRHSFATLLLKDCSVDLRRVSRLLRHKSTQVTEVYLHDLEESEDVSIEKLAALIG